MKICTVMLASFLSCMLIFSASACPHGTHLVGGEASHHKGGRCLKGPAEGGSRILKNLRSSEKQAEKSSKNDRDYQKVRVNEKKKS